MKALALIVAFVLAAGAAWTLRTQDSAAGLPVPAADETPPGPIVTPSDLGPLVAGIRSLKLVTVELSIDVTSEARESSILGSVTATLVAPALLRYGCDLSEMTSSNIVLSPIHKTYVVTVPPPARISAEALGQFARANVTTTGLRSRATDGERLLGDLRRDLQLRASQQAPSETQLEAIRRDSRAQVETLIRKLADKGHTVVVRFSDENREKPVP